MADLYGRLAGVSAILAGFAITFLALLLSHREHSRSLVASMAVTIAAAASLLISAVGWTLIAAFLTQVGFLEGVSGPVVSEFDWIGGRHRMLSFAFIVGLLFLNGTLGLSGWLRSRWLGVFSTTCAVIVTVGIWSVLRHVMG
ncbi:MAG: hypothetical protein GF405_03100 [Candidatus Eisenbacteria bacterium]|nr:hypothetical protein [Candidatus Eisenbacteria bacterium]